MESNSENTPSGYNYKRPMYQSEDATEYSETTADDTTEKSDDITDTSEDYIPEPPESQRRHAFRRVAESQELSSLLETTPQLKTAAPMSEFNRHFLLENAVSSVSMIRHPPTSVISEDANEAVYPFNTWPRHRVRSTASPRKNSLPERLDVTSDVASTHSQELTVSSNFPMTSDDGTQRSVEVPPSTLIESAPADIYQQACWIPQSCLTQSNTTLPDDWAPISGGIKPISSGFSHSWDTATSWNSNPESERPLLDSREMVRRQNVEEEKRKFWEFTCGLIFIAVAGFLIAMSLFMYSWFGKDKMFPDPSSTTEPSATPQGLDL